MIVLNWIKHPKPKQTTFVKNRISNIKQLSKSRDWFHCVGELNPADMATRSKEISSSKLTSFWLSGPDWLKRPEWNWPSDAEERQCHHTLVSNDDSGNSVESRSETSPVTTADHCRSEPVSSISNLPKTYELFARVASNHPNFNKAIVTLFWVLRAFQWFKRAIDKTIIINPTDSPSAFEFKPGSPLRNLLVSTV